MTPHEIRPGASCDVQASGAIELYFYGELNPSELAVTRAHLARCATCRAALDELQVIREALASRPVVSMPASGDWAGFMARLERAVAGESATPARSDQSFPSPRRVPAYATYLAMAALLTLVTISVVFFARSRTSAPPQSASAGESAPALTPSEPTSAGVDATASLAAASGEHFERSKLVVLGLATKDAKTVSSKDWMYERELASDLLNDTRVYRMAAEDRGMKAVAGVMRDLELVLLQTSLTNDTDPDALAQIQRLIQKRDLVEKMQVVATSGL
jgi:hypothetical protein